MIVCMFSDWTWFSRTLDPRITDQLKAAELGRVIKEI